MNQRMLVQYSLVFYDVLRKNKVAKPIAEFNKFLSSLIKDKSTIIFQDFHKEEERYLNNPELTIETLEQGVKNVQS